MFAQHHIDLAKATADTASIGAAGLWLAHTIGFLGDNIVPPLAAVASLAYMCIRIYETKTVQSLLTKDGGNDNSQQSGPSS